MNTKTITTIKCLRGICELSKRELGDMIVFEGRHGKFQTNCMFAFLPNDNNPTKYRIIKKSEIMMGKIEPIGEGYFTVPMSTTYFVPRYTTSKKLTEEEKLMY